jgi:hypothetical protein
METVKTVVTQTAVDFLQHLGSTGRPDVSYPSARLVLPLRSPARAVSYRWSSPGL